VTIDKKEFVKRLNGTAIYWHEVWEMLTTGKTAEQMVGEVLRDVNGEITRENVFALMKMLGETRENWWRRDWIYRGEHYARQAQVEQEFDMWFEDQCHAEKKFLPKWYVDKTRFKR
jgi:hypothetical protein